jgi:hypothetical protein
MINVGVIQASAVLGTAYGVFPSSSDARELMVALMQEATHLGWFRKKFERRLAKSEK